MTEDQIIFIASQPRSGSTLLQSLVSNNEKVATANEPWLLLPMLGMSRVDLVDAKYNTAWAAVALSNFQKKIGEEVYLNELKKFLLSLYARLKTDTTQYVLDKTPRYYEILDEIIDTFPGSKIIVLKRNPFAVLSSIISTWNQKSLSQLYAYRRDILYAPFLLDKFAERYRSAPQIKVVHYETLVQNPAQQLQSIYHWLGLPFNLDILDYSTNEKILAGEYGDPKIRHRAMPTAESIHTWKHHLDHPFWGNFFRGYSSFLGESFLTRYGLYESIGQKPTKEFDYYQLFCAEDAHVDFSIKETLKKLLRYSQYRMTVGSIAKNF